MSKRETMLDWALFYGSLGLAVIPVSQNNKDPVLKDLAHIASTDPEQITAWWTRQPDYNVGFITGEKSGGVFDLHILDDDALLDLRDWESENGELPDSWEYESEAGDIHILFRSDLVIDGNMRSNLLNGVEIIGNGLIALLPPSQVGGIEYEWNVSPESQNITEADDLVLRLAGIEKETAINADELRDHQEVKAVCDSGVARPANTKSPVEFDLINAVELQGLDIPPVEWIIDDLLPIGLTILGAPPKSFKSYMCMDLCLSVCEGRDFLGFHTHKAGCLYLDLESTRRRPKQRINQILGGEKAPDNLRIVTQSAPLGGGFEESIRAAVGEYPDTKVIVVDVFKKIRRSKKASSDPYDRDYEDYGAVKDLADELDIAIILVTHTTKMKHPDDPFNELSGSVGTLGSVDVALVIKKEERNAETAKLYLTGRDLQEECYEMTFNKKSFKWERQGTAEEMEAVRLRKSYEESRVVNAIRYLVKTSGGEWTGTVSELINDSRRFGGCPDIYDDPKKTGKEIRKYQSNLYELDFIECLEGYKGRNRTLTFRAVNPYERKSDK